MKKLITFTASALTLIAGLVVQCAAEDFKAKPSETTGTPGHGCSRPDCVETAYKRYHKKSNEGPYIVFERCTPVRTQDDLKIVTCEDEYGSKVDFVHDKKDRLVRARPL